MSAEATLARWSEIPPESMNPLLTRQFVTGSQAMIGRIVLKKGCLVPRHAHPNEQIVFIFEGALRFWLGEKDALEEKTVRGGELLVIPANLPHSAEALEDTLNFDIFAPPRQDWITGDDSYLR
jgi:quercetin dioxygenase-like cupin family protein